MSRNFWMLPDDVKLTILYLGGMPWKKIGKQFEDRSHYSCIRRLQRLNIPRNRTPGPQPTFPEEHVDPVDWKIWGLRQRGFSKKEIADKVGLRVGTLANRMYRKDLHLHPPAGNPPVGMDV